MNIKRARLPQHTLTVSNTILLATDLVAIEKLVLSEIIWMQDYNSVHNQAYYCMASNFYFKVVFGISTRQVTNIISSLCNKGYIKVVKYQNGDLRHLSYDYNKCFERDIALGLKNPT